MTHRSKVIREQKKVEIPSWANWDTFLQPLVSSSASCGMRKIPVTLILLIMPDNAHSAVPNMIPWE